MNIITDEFIQKTESILKNKCFGSQTLFKKDLAKELGFDPANSKSLSLGLNVISVMFDLKLFKEYKILPGKHGGIVHSPSFCRVNSEKFPEGFLDILNTTLNKNCNYNKAISRLEIAKAMNYNLPQEKIINLISLALQKKCIQGYSGKTGKNGGIIKNKSADLMLAPLAPTAPLAPASPSSPPKDFWAAIIEQQQGDPALSEAENA